MNSKYLLCEGILKQLSLAKQYRKIRWQWELECGKTKCKSRTGDTICMYKCEVAATKKLLSYIKSNSTSDPTENKRLYDHWTKTLAAQVQALKDEIQYHKDHNIK